MRKKIILLVLILSLSACGESTKTIKKNNSNEQKEPSIEYQIAQLGDNELFNTFLENGCVVFEVNREDDNCDFTYQSEFSDNLIKISVKTAENCKDSLGMHGLKGKICNLKKGEYKLQVENLSKKFIVE